MFYQVLWDEDLTIPTQIVPIERNHQLPQHQQSCHQVLHNHEQHHHLVDHEQHPHLVDQGNHHHLVGQGGAEFNSAPARRLSAAFGLDLTPTTAGNKQVLVGTYLLFGRCVNIWGQWMRRYPIGYEVWEGYKGSALLVLPRRGFGDTCWAPPSCNTWGWCDDGYKINLRNALR